MRKLLMMAAVAAMAFGAQASETYSYSLSLMSIPLEVLDGTKVKGIECYLLDKSVTGSMKTRDNAAVMAKFTYMGKATGGDLTGLGYTAVEYTVGGVASTTAPDTVLAKATLSDPIDSVKFTTGDTITWNDMGGGKTKGTTEYTDAVHQYVADNIRAVLVATLADGSEKEFDIKVTMNDSLKELGSNATYSQVVPEPTSGLLVFLGLAGLMLRRKRAA